MDKVESQTNIRVDNLIFLSKCLTTILLLLLALVFYLESSKAKPTYFVESTEGKLTPMLALEEPNVSINSLLRWASIAVTSAYTLDFVDYQQSLDALKPYFTKAGYTNFLAAADARIQDIIKQKLIVTAVVSSTPIILAEGEMSGFYSWQIQIPILLSYQGASEKSTKQNLAVTILVVKVPTKEAETGIGIAQMQDVVMFAN